MAPGLGTRLTSTGIERDGKAGYISAVTTETGTNPASSDPMRLKRIHLPESDDAMRILLAASGFADALAKLRRS